MNYSVFCTKQPFCFTTQRQHLTEQSYFNVEFWKFQDENDEQKITVLYFKNNAENDIKSFIIENNKARGNECLFGKHVQKHEKLGRKSCLSKSLLVNIKDTHRLACSN